MTQCCSTQPSVRSPSVGKSTTPGPSLCIDRPEPAFTLRWLAYRLVGALAGQFVRGDLPAHLGQTGRGHPDLVSEAVQGVLVCRGGLARLADYERPRVERDHWQ